MKQFCCGDVVPGCSRTFSGASERDIMAAVAIHAHDDHGLMEIPSSLIEAVRASIVTV